MKIAICAPSTPFTRDDAARVSALAATHFPQLDLCFDDQCFAEQGHFAGSDALRRDTFVALANDPAFDAIWFARGGYGACRMAEEAIARLTDAARAKTYLGYSDAGYLLGGLYRAGIGRPVHGPMCADIRRDGGEAAVLRALGWLAQGDRTVCDPACEPGVRHAAFNLMTLAMLVGTPLMPDLAGHVLMVEEVSEYLYAFDRAFFHASAHLAGAGLLGLRLGRVSDVPENDRPFGSSAEDIARHWCARHAIPYLGRADIGHDAGNHVVPFGLA